MSQLQLTLLNKSLRVTASLVLAFILTLILFYVMNVMINGRSDISGYSSSSNIISFIRLTADSDTQLKTRNKIVPPKMDNQAPVKPTLSINKEFKQSNVALEMPVLNTEPLAFFGSYKIGEISKASNEQVAGDLVVLSRVAPQYPRKAARKKIEGWVNVEFSVLKDGTVNNITVIDAKPRRIFNRAAIKAISKWKFKPIGNSVTSEKRFNQMIEFKLNND